MSKRNEILTTATESIMSAVRATVLALQALAPSGHRRLILELQVAVNRALSDPALHTLDDLPARTPEIPWEIWHSVPADPWV
ncbi:hypothetical protein [Nocardia sp. NPDC005998]|uniref:hypothetical protein n=1 Tax=Nocardia sp. NPDC005998 TaxID=3156894 RepID=UPI0033AFB1C4